MVKTKKRQAGELVHSSKTKAEIDVLGEDGWVIVKRQRVNILVPPLPISKISISPSPGQNQLQVLPQKTINQPSEFPIETCAQMPSGEQEKSMSPVSKKSIEIAKEITTEHNSTSPRQPRLESRTESGDPDRAGTSKTEKILGVSNPSKIIRRPRVLHCPSTFLGGDVLLNRMMRASNLERKLQRAGGLSRWLASLGLGQFVRLFQGGSLGKFQLVNLTMKKLKDMGADAVGPRRKLMHAIDCICQPYCFEAAFKNVY